MPINTPTGYLDITNATLRGSKIVTTGNIGIANANPVNHLSVGSNLHINDTHSNVLQISGNINAASVVLGGISIAPTFDLEVITNTGNTTPNTLEFNNAATAFVTTANATIGDTLTASKLVGDGSGISAIQSSNVTDFASNVSRITALETDLDNNSSRISLLSSNLSDNSSRISTVSTDLSDNSTRITNLSSNLSDNSSRITALESGDISISGDKTFTGDIIFESNVHMNSGNVFVANTVNLTVSDPIIELGSNNSGTNDLGIIMTRHGASNSNVAIVFDEGDDILRMGYTLNGANDTVVDLDSNALAVSVQGELTVGSNLEVGTANLFVNTLTSRVGIGTASPLQTLHVKGNGQNPVIYMTDPTNNRYASGMGTHNVTNEGQRLDFYNGDSGANGTSLSSSHIRMSINASGNVGIGTATPDGLLHLFKLGTGSNNVDEGAGIKMERYDNYGCAIWSQHRNNEEQMAFRCAHNATDALYGTPQMVLTHGGKLGIGTTSPGSKLHITNTTDSTGTGDAFISGLVVNGSNRKPTECLRLQGQWRSPGSGALLRFTNYHGGGTNPNTGEYNTAGIAGFDYANQWGGGLCLYTSTNTTGGGDLIARMIIDSSGNVGINDTSPSYKLSVHGSFRVHANTSTFGSDGLLHINSRTTQYGSETVALQTTIDGRALTEANPGTHGGESRNVLALQPDGGYVGIGKINPLAKLHVEGSNFIPTSKSYFQTGQVTKNNGNTGTQTKNYFAVDINNGYVQFQIELRGYCRNSQGNGNTDPFRRFYTIARNYNSNASWAHSSAEDITASGWSFGVTRSGGSTSTQTIYFTTVMPNQADNATYLTVQATVLAQTGNIAHSARIP